MSVFADKIRPHVVRELEQASISLNRGEPAVSFKHLECTPSALVGPDWPFD